MTDDERIELAVDIANEIEAVLKGNDEAACFAALSLVIGRAVANNPKRDLCATCESIHRVARLEFDRAMQEKGKPN